MGPKYGTYRLGNHISYLKKSSKKHYYENLFVKNRSTLNTTSIQPYSNDTTNSQSLSDGAIIKTPLDESKQKEYRPPGTHLENGAIKDKPEINRLGRLQAFVLVAAFIYIGGLLSSLGARALHEYEIFTLPDDDDEF